MQSPPAERVPGRMSGPFADAVAMLSDRALRRLLGARAYLRGCDYVRRRAVADVALDESSARAIVRGTAQTPYEVRVSLAPNGISSQCNCPAFSKIDGHCKHVAALLIALREQVRGPGGGSGDMRGGNSNGHGHSAGGDGGGDPGGRRVRRGRRSHAPAAGGGHAPPTAAPMVRTFGATGLEAWLPDDIPVHGFPDLEYRITVRPSALHVIVIDPTVRTPVIPSEALAAQAMAPTGDREALRLLARLERGDVRRGLELRGEDAADLILRLNGRRVLLEPSLMQLRWSDEPIRARFDLELSRKPTHQQHQPPVEGQASGETVVVKASFERKSDGRRFSLSSGAWFEGAPGWHIDTTEGIARPLETRVTPAWLQRLWRTPVIHYPLEHLPNLLGDVIPRIAGEIGAELPTIHEVADEVDLPPHFKLRAFGELIEARVQISAAYGEVELEVRADGMSPPIVVLPPPAPGKKARCVRANVLEQQQAVEAVKDLGFVSDEEGKGLVCRGDDAIGFWTEGLGALPEEWEYFVPDDLVGVQVRTEDVGARARVSSGMDWLGLKITFQAGGITVPPDELAR
ncbi:MAG: SWIM zinc finger family protein, partial [Polyangiales bacterium]